MSNANRLSDRQSCLSQAIDGKSPDALPDTSKEAVSVDIKQEPKDDTEMKSFAQNTMNELLGLYGYERVAESELSKYETSNLTKRCRSPNCESDGSITPRENLPDETKRSMSVRKSLKLRKTSATKSGLDFLSREVCQSEATSSIIPPQTSLSDIIRRPASMSSSNEGFDEDILCAWCRKPGRSALTLQENDTVKAFCSEKCFASCRRANFKRTRVCDWCKQVRQVREYLDNSQSDGRLQFCSTECLDNYKMAVFCSEIHGSSSNADKSPKTGSGAESPCLSKSVQTGLIDVRARSSSPAKPSTPETRAVVDPPKITKRKHPAEHEEIHLNSSTIKHTLSKYHSSPKTRERSCSNTDQKNTQKKKDRDVLSLRGEKVIDFHPNRNELGSRKVPGTTWLKRNTETDQRQSEINRGNLNTAKGYHDFSLPALGRNLMNPAFLQNNYSQSNLSNLNLIQRLLHSSLLSNNNANMFPGIAPLPFHGNIPNLPSLEVPPLGSDNIDRNSFILGMLMAESKKVPNNSIQVPNDASKLHESKNSFKSPRKESTVNCQQQSDDSVLNYDNNPKLPKVSCNTDTANIDSQPTNGKPFLPFPMIVIPLPIPVPIPIPIYSGNLNNNNDNKHERQVKLSDKSAPNVSKVCPVDINENHNHKEESYDINNVLGIPTSSSSAAIDLSLKNTKSPNGNLVECTETMLAKKRKSHADEKPTPHICKKSKILV